MQNVEHLSTVFPETERKSRLSWLINLLPIETIKMAMQTIRAHKFRSFLTVLGIVIGVMTVVAIASILTGMRNSIVSIVEEYGTNNIYAFHLSTGPRLGNRDRAEFQRKPLSLEDVEGIKQQADAIEAVSKSMFLWRIDHTIKFRGLAYKEGDIQAIAPEYAQVANV